MNVRIVKILGPEIDKRRTWLAFSSAYPTADDALVALIPLPPGWTHLPLDLRYSVYVGPGDNHCHNDVIVASEAVDRILFVG